MIILILVDSELQVMNKNKIDKPFLFPDSFILAIGYIRYAFQLPYRQTEGIIKATGKRLPNNSPSYGHICKRINRLDIDIIKKGEHMNEDDDYIIVSIDSIGIKVTDRGQWMNEKWNAHNKKKNYLKIHIAVDVKTKEILALDVTYEKTHDGKILKKLVNHVLDNQDKKKIKSVLADGAYDSNTNFQYLEEKRFTPGIKVRNNSIISIRNNRLRNKEVMRQSKDYLKWKKKRKYGHRWISETVFSTIKRTFGEHVSATRFQNMVKEMMIKVSLYNLFRRI